MIKLIDTHAKLAEKDNQLETLRAALIEVKQYTGVHRYSFKEDGSCLPWCPRCAIDRALNSTSKS